jgi:hypothetical protein
MEGSTLSYYSFINNVPYYYSLLPTSDVGYPIGQFSVNPIPLVVGLIANTAAAVVSAILMRRERHKASIILAFGTGILVFFGLGLVNVFNW